MKKKKYYAISNLKKLLKQKNIKLKQIANDVGVSNQYILNLFNGQRNLNLELFVKIKDVLKLTARQAIRLTIDDKISSFKSDELCIRADLIFRNQNINGKPEKYIKEEVEENNEGDEFHLVRIITQKEINKTFENYETAAEDIVEYLYETYYRDMFNEINIEKTIEQDSIQVINNENEILTEILSLTKGLDIKGQQYIRDCIKLYLDYNK